MLAVAFALSASLLWGFADFAGGFFSRRVSAVVVVLALETGGLLGAAVLLLATGEAPPGWEAVAYAAVAGLAGAGGLVCFFRGMALGSMAVVAPVFASGAAVIPAAVGLATGDTITAVVGLGVTLVVVGIVLASLEGTHEAERARDTRKAVAFALVGAVGAATYVVGADAASDDSVLWTLLIARAAAVPCLAFAVRATGLRLPGGRDVVAIGCVGLVDLAATACFGLATTRGALAVVAVLGAMYPVVTASLARIVLHERIRRIQVAGVAFALLGVALVAAG